MLTIHDKHIILGSIGGASAPVLPDGWGAGWLAPPDVVDNGNGTGTINGVPSMVWLLCPAYQNANNRFYWLANSSTGNTAYTVKNADGSVLYTDQKAFNVVFDYAIDYSQLTGNGDEFGAKQYIVEITPTTSGASLASVVSQSFPAQTTVTTIDAAILANPLAFDWRLKTLQYLQAVTPTTSGTPLSGTYAKFKKFTSTSAVIGSDGYSYGTKVVDINYPNATTFATNTVLANNPVIVYVKINAPNVAQSGLIIFGDGTSPAATRNLCKCLMPGFRCGFSVRYCDMSAAALNALSDSLGTAYTTGQVLDYRNNPGSAACDTSIATAKGYTVLTA